MKILCKSYIQGDQAMDGSSGIYSSPFPVWRIMEFEKASSGSCEAHD